MAESRKTAKRKPSRRPPAERGADAAPAAPKDVVLVHSRTEDGNGLRVVRQRGEELSLGEVRPLEEGKAIHGDVVRLKNRQEHPALFDVETELSLEASSPKAAKPRRRRAGPSRVASEQYRSGWESLWGRKAGRRSN